MHTVLSCVLLLLIFIFFRVDGDTFSIQGNKVYYNNQWVKFKGIGLSCTEYMMKPDMDDPSKSYYGNWAYAYCFGGPPAKGSPVTINAEVKNLLSYLIPDGPNFNTNPTVQKVAFETPYDQVIEPDAPKSHPIVRIPMTGSCYLYNEDNDSGDHTMYQGVIDLLIQALTSQNISVVLDLHWSCPDTTKLACTGAQASMAQRNYGSHPGSLVFWDTLSAKYGKNPFVFYELYNEPWIQEFIPWYSGDGTYVGMKEMYDTIRKNTPTGIIIIGGKDQYALDAQSGLSFHLKYKQDTGAYPTNIIWNIHPYQGAAQGLEHSLRSAMRLALALKTIGPVILTEFGQYCCGSGKPCRGAGSCNDLAHSQYFVYNIVNMCEQYDISWIGWAWRGTNVNNANRPCTDGQTECNQPDMRDNGGVLTDGTYGGANWKQVWSNFVSAPTIKVNDVSPGNINKTDIQVQGFLPRPCIQGQFNLGGICGYDLSFDVNTLNYTDLISQSLYDSILPGLPPKGNCLAQGCDGIPCQTYTGPCKKLEKI